jgi:DNA ligase (NAD+)
MNFIEKCQEAYGLGESLISNEEYDALVRLLGEDSIGHTGDIKHWKRMWSLEKVYPCRGDSLPANLSAYVKTPKLDGCAVDALYYRGHFIRGLTRGDGIKGQDITKKLAYLVPLDIGECEGYVQVTGEVATTKSVSNQRNFASGALNPAGTNMVDFTNRIEEGGLVFVAYTIETDEKQFKTYHDSMDALRAMGFLTVTDENLPQIPTDGIVYRINDMEAYVKAGFTAKANKGSFAVKEDEEGIPTTLTAVTWDIGKSGKVTPVAQFNPIDIDGATVTRATLNNIGYMEAMGITHIGQTVYVIRAGGIIPKIVGADAYDE